MKKLLIVLTLLAFSSSCKKTNTATNEETLPTAQIEEEIIKKPFFWEGANIYFLLTDRFNNGDSRNDINFSRTDSTAVLRGFKGGDIAGITQKIEEGF